MTGDVISSLATSALAKLTAVNSELPTVTALTSPYFHVSESLGNGVVFVKDIDGVSQVVISTGR